MSSRGKKRTTMAKLDREARQRDRRDHKPARKEARREAAAAPPSPDGAAGENIDIDVDDLPSPSESIAKETS